MQRANSAGWFRHGCPRKLLSSGKSAGRCGHRPLHIPRGSSMKSNISGEIIGSRRWQATGGQRVQRANSAGRFQHDCPRKSLSSGKPAGRCGHRPLHIPRGSSMKFNISGEIIGSRRWQATGGQRVQRANSAGRFQHDCPRKLLSSGKSAGRCGHRLLHIPNRYNKTDCIATIRSVICVQFPIRIRSCRTSRC